VVHQRLQASQADRDLGEVAQVVVPAFAEASCRGRDQRVAQARGVDAGGAQRVDPVEAGVEVVVEQQLDQRFDVGVDRHRGRHRTRRRQARPVGQPGHEFGFDELPEPVGRRFTDGPGPTYRRFCIGLRRRGAAD
jgi:hypothetical protein